MTLPSEIVFNELPGNTIVPSMQFDMIFIQYLNRLYEDIAFAVNNKDNVFFPIRITDTPTDIPLLPNFGAFIVAISGALSGQPAYVTGLTKADALLAGDVPVLPISSQVGTLAPWVGATLTITSTLTNFQINHNVPNVVGNFNLRFITTI